MSEKNSERPSRTLRDRATYRHIDVDSLGKQIHTDYIVEKKVVEPIEETIHDDIYEDDDIITPETSNIQQEKPSDFTENSNSYLDKLDEELEKKENEKDEKSKVKVLNLREKSVSTKILKEESKEDIKKSVKKISKQIEEVEETFEETKESITEVKNKLQNNVSIIAKKASLFGVKVAETMLTAPKDFILSLLFGKKKVVKVEEPNESEEKKTKFKEPPKTKYSQLLAKKIKFVAYNKEPLAFDDLPAEVLEEVFMANAISDIRYCSKFVTELPLPEKGVYASKKISNIFENITNQDINRFLYYVANNPDAFIGQNYKLSEAFATWILRKSHLL